MITQTSRNCIARPRGRSGISIATVYRTVVSLKRRAFWSGTISAMVVRATKKCRIAPRSLVDMKAGKVIGFVDRNRAIAARDRQAPRLQACRSPAGYGVSEERRRPSAR